MCVNMNKRKREEYEMQLFGFHSNTVNATLKSLIERKIQSRCQRLTESLEKKYKPNDNDIQLLQKNKRQLMRAYALGCKSQFPAIENCVKKLIVIPDHILLDEDKVQSIQYTNDDFNEIKNKLEDLQQRLKKATIFNAMLKEEIEIIDQFDKSINIANTVCDVIENNTKYPTIDNSMIKLIDSYNELQKNFDKSNNLNRIKNKDKCSTLMKKGYDINFP